MRRELSNTTLVGVVTTMIVVFGLVLILVFASGSSERAHERAAQTTSINHH